MYDLTFGGRSLSDFGCVISGPEIYNGPEKITDSISIPGRNGDLIVDKEYFPNVTITYPFSIINNVSDNINNLKEYLYRASSVGFQRIETDYDPDTYRKGLFLGPFEVTPWWQHQAVEGELTFTCYPQRWLTSGEAYETVAAGDTLTLNPNGGGGAFRAMPILKVYGTGTVTLGGSIFEVLSIPDDSPLVIDCETKQARDANGVSCNASIGRVYYWPQLQGGETIENNTSSQVEISCRWWKI